MALNQFTASFLAALLICPPALSRNPQSAAQPQSQKEEKSSKEDKELEKKALALLDEVVGEAMSLKLVENRIYVLTMAADLFWKPNENRARALLAEAINQFMAIEHSLPSGGQPETEAQGLQTLQTLGVRMELRTQLLQTVAARDSRMALDFLRASRLPDEGKIFGGKGYSREFERNFEMQLAIRIAENDPRMALQIAEESLKQGVNHQVYEIWANLLAKDPKSAARLSSDIISAIKSADALKDYQSAHVVTSMLTQLRPQIRTSSNTKGSSQSLPQEPTQEARDMFRDLLELMVSMALKITTAQLLDFQEQGQARSLLTQVQMLLPDIEKHLPARAPAVRAKLAQFDKAFYRQPMPQEPFEDMENKSPDELIAMAAKSQDEFKNMFYQQALAKLIEQGDTARARQILKDFSSDNEGWNIPLLAEIERKEREQAVKDGKLEEARKSVSRLASSEERALALIELAAKAETNKDQKSQQELLKEAGELLGDQMETRSQVEAQLALAAVSLNLAPDRGFEILGSAIDRLNTVLNAVATITKFDQGGVTTLGAAANAMDGEMRLSAGEFANITANLDQQLLAFTQKDFDRTVALLKRWQVNEVRLTICLSLLNRILGPEKKSEEGAYYLLPYGRAVTTQQN